MISNIVQFTLESQMIGTKEAENYPGWHQEIKRLEDKMDKFIEKEEDDTKRSKAKVDDILSSKVGRADWQNYSVYKLQN